MFFVGKWKTENYVGTLSGVVAIWYMQHLGLLPVVSIWNPYDMKGILLLGGSLVLIVYKKIFSAQK